MLELQFNFVGFRALPYSNFDYEFILLDAQLHYSTLV